MLGWEDPNLSHPWFGIWWQVSALVQAFFEDRLGHPRATEHRTNLIEMKVISITFLA